MTSTTKLIAGATGSGAFTSAGVALANKSMTHTAGTGKWDADDVTWATATITAKYAVLVRQAGGSLVSGDLLIAYEDLNTDGVSETVSSIAGPFTVTWNAAGIITIIANAS